MKRKIVALWLVLSLLLVPLAAGAEATVTAEETAAMVEAMMAAVMEDEEITTLFEEEITEEKGTIPCNGYADEVLTVYTLKHGGSELCFLQEIIGEADENGLYPLYITLHGGGEAEAAFNNDQWIDMFYY